MRLRKVVLRAFVTIALTITAALALAVTIAVGGGRSDVPAPYRYAGVVENGRRAPAHYIATGDGFRFYFFDALSQGRRSERYRVCVGPAGKAATRCWSRTARFGLGRVAFPVALPPNFQFGPLVARWFIGSRIVATWPFLYVRGGG
jgi:hypothetical protein